MKQFISLPPLPPLLLPPPLLPPLLLLPPPPPPPPPPPLFSFPINKCVARGGLRAWLKKKVFVALAENASRAKKKRSWRCTELMSCCSSSPPPFISACEFCYLETKIMQT